MSISRTICSSFTSNETLAFFSSDSVLHLWDVKTGKQTQQYLPSSHLTSTFTCLSWKNETNAQKINKTKRVKEKSEFIALGTATGEIVLYNVENGELVLKYSGGHSEQVNCISWTRNNSFYSCSDDGYITEWEILSPKHKDKWKADKRHLYSLCIGPHSKTILAAGKMINLWDLKTKSILQKFNGHTSPVLSLMYLNCPTVSQNPDDSPTNLDGLYFVSAACEDRALSAWHITNSIRKKIATCSFSLPSEPYFVDVLMSKSPDKPTWLLASTEDDQLVVFSHILNGHSDKPFKARKSIKVVSEDAQPLKVICASFNQSNEKGDIVITIAYGSSYRVAFDHVKLKKHKEFEIILIRTDPAKSEVVLEQDKLKLREATKSKNFSSIAPGVVAHAGLKGEGRKRKRSPSINEGQMTLEERVTAQSVDVAPSKGVQKPDSMAVLLTQGLQSDDKQILKQVLQHSNDQMIKNTVSQIPINYVIPLIKHLTSRLQGLPAKSLIHTKWLKATLSHHSSFLTTFPTAIPLLEEVYQYIEIRKRTHDRLPTMQGKLDLMLSQIASRKAEEHGVESEEHKALLVYEEVDSSDEFDDTEMTWSDAHSDD